MLSCCSWKLLFHTPPWWISGKSKVDGSQKPNRGAPSSQSSTIKGWRYFLEPYYSLCFVNGQCWKVTWTLSTPSMLVCVSLVWCWNQQGNKLKIYFPLSLSSLDEVFKKQPLLMIRCPKDLTEDMLILFLRNINNLGAKDDNYKYCRRFLVEIPSSPVFLND